MFYGFSSRIVIILEKNVQANINASGDNVKSSQIGVAIERECVSIAPLERGFHALLGPVRAVGVGLHRQDRATFHALRSVTDDVRGQSAVLHLPQPVTFPRQVLRPDFRARQVYAIFYWIHLSSARFFRQKSNGQRRTSEHAKTFIQKVVALTKPKAHLHMSTACISSCTIAS